MATAYFVTVKRLELTVKFIADVIAWPYAGLLPWRAVRACRHPVILCAPTISVWISRSMAATASEPISVLEAATLCRSVRAGPAVRGLPCGTLFEPAMISRARVKSGAVKYPRISRHRLLDCERAILSAGAGHRPGRHATRNRIPPAGLRCFSE